MNKVIFLALLGLLGASALWAVPGLALEYGGGVQVTEDFSCYVLQESTQLLRFYKLTPAENGFGIESFYVNMSNEISTPTFIYEYQHSQSLQQDGGAVSLVLAKSFMGNAYILHKNDLYLFMTVIDQDMQVSTVVTSNPGLSFEQDPIFRRTFCFLDPELMILSNQANLYLLNLQTQSCSFYWTFPNAVSPVSLNRVDDEHVIMSAWLGYKDETNFLLNYQTMVRTHIDYLGWNTVPISGDFGNKRFLANQNRHDGDGMDLVRTLLMDIHPNNTVSYFPLYYGGSPNFFDYTPMHTFEQINLLGDNRFLAICTDLFEIPRNRKLGIFRIEGNSIVYDQLFTELHSPDHPARIYKIQDGYYLSFHYYTPTPESAKLLDMESQTISLPDTNVIVSPGNLLSTDDNSFYIVNSGNHVHCYRLVEPSSVPPENPMPPALLHLSIGPNPFKEKLNVTLNCSKQDIAKIEVYDLRGRLIIKLAEGSPGDLRCVWDGKSAAGRRLPSGIYIVRATASGSSKAMKVVLLD
ncbi:MAG: T9SS type A sorting domain-containing protein [Candidatus Cloacimonadaceae bacterium]|jgi:hypothetical protein|nr:T9SS type A sorting domain-containing protein [Candidatus Cloacimonadota bacterium]MDY0127741.1 T9SS type A sorting domain-containing protein [Candidatus Cloacimonadaceae bacterium]MCB5255833.1 T9SS type A sorting domain-containing protein [Candidatus Cloacimonadota bacterium]MCK9178088.1 T9SS type A sorting domain-containing protein [Candidatus Cloacimonadota bacterium]MCK9243248.1 T9SS type A sorting domain-containing protein [Candidatus Cloacimonadota bacterium]